MRVLSVVHGTDAGSELYGPAVRDAGHSFAEWSPASGEPLPGAGYDAVLVFGGAMHADQDAIHPWLGDEARWLRGLLERGVPTLGICLGVQMLARAAGAWVGPLPEREAGWHEVELSEAGVSDPVLGALPRRFDALEWHYYTYGVPDGAVELARSEACTQAFRLGDACWGVQFHPEVSAPQLERWLVAKDVSPADAERLRAETRERIGGWNALGRELCHAFLAAAERLLARAA
ncbi:MAG TPA: type 1 glutamine amidotransferase [Gaiellaceae bacterium]|nr:type 1 glutamine amidotransferase [Gaiellaceae bacterium]